MSLKAWSSRGTTARHHDLRSSASSGFVTGTGGRAQAKRERIKIPTMKIRFIYRNIALSLSSIHPYLSTAELLIIAGLNLPPKQHIRRVVTVPRNGWQKCPEICYPPILHNPCYGTAFNALHPFSSPNSHAFWKSEWANSLLPILR